MKRDDSSPEAYLDSVTGDLLDTFLHIRSIIQNAAPEATVTMQYGMPYYMLDDKPWIGLAAQKNHIGVYIGIQALNDFSERLSGIDRGKSCLRFKKVSKVPDNILNELFIHAKTLPLEGC